MSFTLSKRSLTADRGCSPSIVRILLADDHDLVRTGLRFVLEWVPGWTICAEAEDGAVAVEAARRLRPDVAVIDLDMPVLHGLDAIAAIRQVSPSTRMVALSAVDLPGLSERALAAGASRFALKMRPATDITTAIRDLVEDGNRPSAARQTGSHEIAKLTQREVEIVRLLALGKSNVDAGRLLGIAPTTVETHRSNVMRKLEVQSIVELVHFAIREELVRVERAP